MRTPLKYVEWVGASLAHRAPRGKAPWSGGRGIEGEGGDGMEPGGGRRQERTALHRVASPELQEENPR